MASIPQTKTRFATNPMEGLLHCQRFISAWMTTTTIWSSRIRTSFPGGPQFPLVQESLLSAMATSATGILHLLQRLATYQYQIDNSTVFRTTGPVENVGLSAWSRVQAMTFATGLIHTLDVADSCFSFGPHFAGGEHYPVREAFFLSPKQCSHRGPYEDAVSLLAAKAGIPPFKRKKGGVPSRKEINDFGDVRQPAAAAFMQSMMGSSISLFAQSGRLLTTDPSSPVPPPPVEFLKEAPKALALIDDCLQTAEAFFAALPSHAEAIRSLGEEELAKLLCAIG